MATPARFDWPVVAGDTETLVVVLPGVDVTARTYEAQIKSSRDLTGDPIEAVGVDTQMDDQDGEVVMTLTPTQTRALEGQRYLVYVLQESVGGIVTTLVGGSVSVTRDVTR